MSEDIVETLRTGASDSTVDVYAQTCFVEAAAEIERLRGDISVLQLQLNAKRASYVDAENARLHDALQKVATGNWPRPHATTHRDDGQPSKYDLCPHGQRIYESCDECVCAFARGVVIGAEPSTFEIADCSIGPDPKGNE